MLRFFPLLVCLVFVAPNITKGDEDSPLMETRQSWAGGRQPVTSRMKEHTAGKIRSVVLHHSQTPNEPPRLELRRLAGILSYHSGERGWGDIAYHYLVGASGKVYEGRNPKFQGDSGTAYNLDGRLQICLLGDFSEKRPDDAALDSLVTLVVASLKKHGLSPADLTTHRKLAATDCPGDTFQAWFDGGGLEKIEERFKLGLEPQ